MKSNSFFEVTKADPTGIPQSKYWIKSVLVWQSESTTTTTTSFMFQGMRTLHFIELFPLWPGMERWGCRVFKHPIIHTRQHWQHRCELWTVCGADKWWRHHRHHWSWGVVRDPICSHICLYHRWTRVYPHCNCKVVIFRLIIKLHHYIRIFSRFNFHLEGKKGDNWNWEFSNCIEISISLKGAKKDIYGLGFRKLKGEN